MRSRRNLGLIAWALVLVGCSEGFDFTMDDLEQIRSEGPQQRIIVVESRGPDGTVRVAHRSTLGTVARFPLEVPVGHRIQDAAGCGGRLIQPTVFEVESVETDCAIVVEIQPKMFNVETYSVVDGHIDHDVVQIAYGESHVFDLAIRDGYEIQAAEGCGGDLEARRFTTAIIEADCTITVSFEQKYYTLSVRTDGQGTTNIEQEQVAHGTSVEILLFGNVGYEPEAAIGCGVELRGGLFVTAPIEADCLVEATFAKKRYEVTTKTLGAGRFEPERAGVLHGNTQAFRLLPEDGQRLESVTDCAGTRAGNRYITGAITKDCAVFAVFTPKRYALSVVTDGHGTGNVESAEIEHGSVAAIQFEPNEGYVLDTVQGCEGSMQGGVFMTAPMVEPCVVNASFVQQRYLVRFEATHGGTVRAQTVGASHGERIPFEVVPDVGFSVETVTGCDASESDGTYQTAPMERSCEVLVTFGVSRYTVRVQAPDNGRAYPLTSEVTHGGTQELFFEPNGGYTLGAVSGCGLESTEGPHRTEAIAEHCEINVWFELESYAVTLDTGPSVRVVASDDSSPWSPQKWTEHEAAVRAEPDAKRRSVASIQRGSEYVVEFELAPHHELVVENTCDELGRVEAANRFVVSAITKPCIISLEARLVSHSVTVAPLAGGTANWMEKAVKHGEQVSVTFSAAEGQELRKVTGCAGEVSVDPEYATGPILAPCTIEAEFTKAFPAPTAEVGIGRRMRLTWQEMAGTESYRLYLAYGEGRDQRGPEMLLATLPPGQHSYTHVHSLESFRGYWDRDYWVEACGADGFCVRSDRRTVDIAPTAGIAEIVGPAQTLGDAFGKVIALSGDGLTMAVGAPGIRPDLGTVYVFERDGTTWRQSAVLAPTPTADWTPVGFGSALAFDDAGDRLVVAHPRRSTCLVETKIYRTGVPSISSRRASVGHHHRRAD